MDAISSATTYHTFLSYNSVDATLVLKVADELRKRGCTCFLDRWYLEPGRDWVAALERALANSRSVAVFLGPGEMGRWQQRERAWALDRQAGDPQFAVIPVLLPGCQPPLGFLRQMMWIDLREDQSSMAQLDRLAAALRGESVLGEGQLQPRATVCPYRGLLYFREEDAAFFFGRDVYIEKLIQAVERRTLVAIVGASGCGKSSVVRAGLVPRLRAHDSRPVWEIATMVPGENPLHALADVLLPLIEPKLSGYELISKASTVAEDLKNGKIPLWKLVEGALLQQQGTDRLLLVVDQWEELYTQCDDAIARRRFIEELLAATALKQSPLSVVLTVRDDFYGTLSQDRPLLDQLQDSTLTLGPMTRKELREAIEKPAANVDLQFQAGLVDRLLDDAREEPGRLPLLEFALEELWNRQDHGQLTHEAYDALERLSGAIAKRAESVYKTLDPAEQAAAPGLFRRLVRAGTKTAEDTRRRADFHSLDDASKRVVRRLADERLLVTTRVETSGNAATETVEVAHEELLRRWSLLREWIDADRKFLQWRGRLAPLLEQYQRDAESALLRHGALREARQFYPVRQAELENAEEVLVSASFAADRRRKLTLWSSVGASLVLVCGIIAGAWWAYLSAKNHDVVDRAVADLLDPALSNVDGVLEKLEILRPYAQTKLKTAFEEAQDPRTKLRLAYGLIAVKAVTVSDHDVATFIFDRVADASADDSANLVEALSQLSDHVQVVQELLRRSDLASAKDPAVRTRYSVAALSLGAVEAMKQLRFSDGDPTNRTRFVSDFSAWPGDLRRIANMLPSLDQEPDIRSGLCAAIGGLALNSRSDLEKRAMQDVIFRLYQEAPDSGTHSAAGWALRQWKLRPLEIRRLATHAEREQWPKEHFWHINSLGLTMVRIPAGTYRIGSEEEVDNKPRDEKVSEYWLGACEVTVEQFLALFPELNTPQTGSAPVPPSDLAKPMSGVSWYDAVKFCNRLSDNEKLSRCYKLENEMEDKDKHITEAEVEIVTGTGYRLPKEVEWEIACRARTKTTFSFGDEYGDLDDYGWSSENSRSIAHPVAEKRPNSWGLHDMHGNLWEWCEDGLEKGVSRVYRGGCWSFSAVSCRSSYRDRAEPSFRFVRFGFRVARSSSGPESSSGAAEPPSEQRSLERRLDGAPRSRD